MYELSDTERAVLTATASKHEACVVYCAEAGVWSSTLGNVVRLGKFTDFAAY